MNYQFVVICISEERKKIIEEQFNNLKKECKVIFLQACIPSNSIDFLEDIELEKDKKIICCMRSHLKAMDFCCRDFSPDFSIILEDDVAFHKTQFLNVIEELISDWDTKVAPNQMMSLGWIPTNNYSDYLNRKEDGTIKSILGSKLFGKLSAIGTQCYMIRKKDVTSIVKMFNYPSKYTDLHKFLSELMKPFNCDSKNDSIYSADHSLNWILDQKALFPPIVIEQDIQSNLGHNNKTLYWDKFFEGYEMIKDDYYL